MILSRPGVRFGAAGAAAAVAACLAFACGGGKASSPSPSITPPALISPSNGSEVDTLRPELVVNNATSTAAGDRTYEFQVAASADFSTGVVDKAGVTEGGGGRTSFALEEDLKIATAYFWRVRAAQAGITSAWSNVGTFRTRAKAPPVVAISLPKERADADEELTLIASVQNSDGSTSGLTYEWAAEKGIVSGSGAVVTWRAPRGATPGPIELRVTVTDTYTVTNADGSTRQAENKVTATTKVTYNDSYKEVRELALDFIGDFANSNNSPEFCVRNFSDSCAGKASETSDIATNRAIYTIQSADYGIRDIIFNADKTLADVVARCNFVSTVKATGRTEIATGTCLLQATYEKSNWFLCDSKYDGSTRTAFAFWGKD